MSTEMTESLDIDDFSKITIKEEPLEYLEIVNESIDCDIEIKDELEDISEFNNSVVPIPHSDHTYIQRSPDISSLNNTTSPPIHTDTDGKSCSAIGVRDAPVTRKILINGQEKTCVLIKMPQLDNNIENFRKKLRQNASRSPRDVNTVVQCPRCKNTVELTEFRKHIDTCPPKHIRKPGEKKSDDSVANRKTNSDLDENVPKACNIVAPKDKIASYRNETRQLAYKLATRQLRTVSNCTPPRESLIAHVNSTSSLVNENESCRSVIKKPLNKPRRKLYSKDDDLNQNILKPTSPMKEVFLTHKGENDPSCSESATDEQFKGSILEALELRPRSKSLTCPESETSNCLADDERNVLLRTMAKSFSQTDCGTSIKNKKSDVPTEDANSNKKKFVAKPMKTRSYSRAINENINSVNSDHLVGSILKTQESASESIRSLNNSPNVSKPISEPKSRKTISVALTKYPTSNDSSVENEESNEPTETVDREESFSSRRIRTRSCSRMVTDKSLQSEKNIGTDDTFLSRRSRSKSCSRMLNKDARTSEDNVSLRSMRSTSVQRGQTDTSSTWNSLIEVESQNKNGQTFEKGDTICHASQMDYYQKFLEVRSRSVSNKLNLDKQSISTKTKASEVDDKLGNTKDGCESDSAHVRLEARIGKASEPGSLSDPLLLEDNTLSCSVCSFTTDKNRALKNHERNHRKFGRSVFKCIYCNQKYTRYALYLHIQTVHPGQKFDFIEDTNTMEKWVEPETFSCKECPFSAKTQILLAEHSDKHVAESETVHSEKNQIESEPLSAKTYEENCGNSSEKRNSSHKCPECSYASPSRSKMDVHKRSHENNIPIKSCPNNCSFRSTPKPLQAHLKKCISNYTNKDDATKKSLEKTNIKPVSVNTKSKTFQCSQCDFSSKLRIRMNFHMKKKHTKALDYKIGNFKCPHCSFTSNYIQNLRRHLRSHKLNYRATPSVLKKHFRHSRYGSKSQEDLNDDQVKDCSAFSFGANKKSQDTSKIESSMKTAVESIPQEKPLDNFPCKLCPFVCADISLLKNHMITHDQNQANNRNRKNTFNCKRCSYVSSRIDGIKRHMSTHINKQPINKCRYCDFNSTPTALLRHIHAHKMITHDQNQPNNQNRGKTFSCHRCSYVSNRIDFVKRHMSTHIKKQHINKCQYCDFHSTPTALLRHTCVPKTIKHDQSQPNNQNRGNTLSCQLCSYVGDRIKSLKIHMNTHKKNQPINKCQYCDFRSTPTALFKHICAPKNDENQPNNRNRENTFSCQLCSYVTRRIKFLKVHMNAHKKNHPINKCQYCDFHSTPTALSRHYCAQKSDQNQPINQNRGKTFSCQLCSYVGRRIMSLKRHMNTHKKKQPINKCQYCDFHSTPTALFRHVCAQKIANKSDGSSNNKLSTQVAFSQTSIENNLGDLRAPGIETVSKTLFKCSKCSFSTNLRIKLKIHTKKHDTSLLKSGSSYEEERGDVVIQNAAVKRSLLRCSKCSFTTNMRLNLETHTLQRHPSDFKYKSVSTGSESLEPKRKHLHSDKRDEMVEKCPHCNFTGTNKCLLRHIIMHKDQKSAKEKHQILNINPRLDITSPREKPQEHAFTNQDQPIKRDVLQGNNKGNSSEILFKCSQCSFSTNLRVKLKMHLEKHKKTKSISQRNQLIGNCPYCSYSASTTNILRHIKRKHGKIQFSQEKIGIINASARIQNAVANGRLHITDFKEKSVNRKPVKAKSYFMLRCNMCSFVTTQNETFREHSTTHEQNQPIEKCRQCNFRSTPRDLIEHVREHNVKPKLKVYSCELCSALVRPSNLKYHMQTHANSQPVEQCTQCEFKSTKRQLQKHVLQMKHHNPEPLTKRLILHTNSHSQTSIKKCPKCQFKSTSPLLSIHMREKHHFVSTAHDDSPTETSDLNENTNKITIANGKVNPFLGKVKKSSNFQCDICSFSTPLRIKLKFHRSKMHPELNKVSNETENESNTKLGCSKGKVISDLRALSEHHLLSNTENGTKTTEKAIYKCGLCSYTSPNEFNLKCHVVAHKLHAIAKCSFCDFKGTASMMARHKKNCSALVKTSLKKVPRMKLLSCEVCSFATYSPAVLKIHSEQKHKNRVKSFKCRYCSFSSYWGYLVDRHMHSHTVLKMPIKQCPKCNFKSTPAALAAHVHSCIKG